jgi:N-dimethylarginine dimethylaminohydrolase
MKISSYNDWDRLQEVVVGMPDSAAFLTSSQSVPPTGKALEIITDLAQEAFPKHLLDQVAEDLNNFCNVIRRFGAKVLRASSKHTREWFSHAGWCSTGINLYNVRDLHLIVGNTVIESPSHMRHRYFESDGLREIWYDYLKEGFKWVTAPKPRLEGEYSIPFFDDSGKKFHKLAEKEILFEAANTLRIGKDLLYLVSASGNHLGAQWLQHILGDQYRVHTTEGIYRSAHIDSTVICLRPGLVLLNGERVNEKNCPKLFEKWEKVYFHDIAPYPAEIVTFHENVSKKVQAKLQEYGITSDLDWMTSLWTGMNLLSLDPSTVVVDERQTALIRTLEKYKITAIPLRFTNQYLMKGGFHCSTLDTVRAGSLENYFG